MIELLWWILGGASLYFLLIVYWNILFRRDCFGGRKWEWFPKSYLVSDSVRYDEDLGKHVLDGNIKRKWL